jgi:hypothetical protein
MLPRVLALFLTVLAMSFAIGCQDVCPENTHGPEDCPEPAVEDNHENLPDAGAEFSQQEASFCNCMLFNCHDEFHETYGVSDLEARDNCLLEISSTPTGDPNATSGNVQECRVHFCEEAASRDCQAALGNIICR